MSASPVTCPDCGQTVVPAPKIPGVDYFGEARFCPTRLSAFETCGCDLVGRGVAKAPVKVAPSSCAYRGVHLEAALSAACKLYARQCSRCSAELVAEPAGFRCNRCHPSLKAIPRASVRKIQVPLARTKDGRVLHARSGRPDFEGVLAGGVAVGFEAKSTEGPSLPLAMLRDGQRKSLHRIAEMGGRAGLVIELRAGSPDAIAWWLDWDRVERFEALGERASIPQSLLDSEGFRLPRRGRALLFLDGGTPAPIG